jgi:hypothetical protein
MSITITVVQPPPKIEIRQQFAQGKRITMLSMEDAEELREFLNKLDLQELKHRSIP